MSLERRCHVLRVDQGGVLLRAEDAACVGCFGCGGRCALLSGESREIVLSRADVEGDPVANETMLLVLDDEALQRQALRAYGLPLFGLVAGASVGSLLGFLTELPLNPLTAAGALLGTLLSVAKSKRGAGLGCRARSLPAAESEQLAPRQ